MSRDGWGWLMMVHSAGWWWLSAGQWWSPKCCWHSLGHSGAGNLPAADLPANAVVGVVRITFKSQRPKRIHQKVWLPCRVRRWWDCWLGNNGLGKMIITRMRILAESVRKPVQSQRSMFRWTSWRDPGLPSAVVGSDSEVPLRWVFLEGLMLSNNHV